MGESGFTCRPQRTHTHARTMEIERKDVNVSALKDANLPIYWVLGGPGSGKGTQCENLGVKTGFTHFSSGDLLRNEVMSGSKRGLQIYKLMELGQLVPTVVVLDLLAEAMVEALYGGKAKGFLLDAYPMNLEQAAAFEQYIYSPAKVIYLSLEQEVMEGRLLERGNFDDKIEAIQRRCKNFQEQTRPVLEKYKDKVLRVESNRPADEITNDIMKGL